MWQTRMKQVNYVCVKIHSANFVVSYDGRQPSLILSVYLREEALGLAERGSIRGWIISGRER